MENKILGLHHITAIADQAKRNVDFYTKVLGLRLLKKTVNFDDPGTYHLYYGDEKGSAGTILTFFPYEGSRRGRAGTGMITHISYSVPASSFAFWLNRFAENNVPYQQPAERFGEKYIAFQDPDGLQFELVAAQKPDTRQPWETSEVNAEVATRGFHGATLTLRDKEATATILTDIFEYTAAGQEGNRYRFVTGTVDQAATIDLVEAPNELRGTGGAGTNHHIAFRVKNEEVLLQFRDKIARQGFNITEKIDRNYFYSLYFREPGGVLFEIATDNPGFGIDEPFDQLGSSLLLPPQYEPRRADIEAVLPRLD
ncbi:ring-cleaving dioxygenase [Adhaeribacter pallidiroseus]|uniref:Putative ring-cleaving dioxygenase MhqO n=1 Tax=Adhaeribacter pallidiroseus TaxID=2072847 RepID=A0A369QBJ6_9BACT|nr:ring-cleaving dioxygenase [Adhaeribacter pallidiroseus]RDC62291.1 putative ring-cleaving dioxygenase MhqO [Adhaeribacter pallidiroseus]